MKNFSQLILCELILIVFSTFNINAQETFTRKDSLHGSLRFERTCYDVLRYDLNIKINPEEKSITGCNEISFKVVENTSKIQLDLFENMHIDSIVLNAVKLKYKREFNAVFIDFETPLAKNSQQKITFYYSGNPNIATNPPWGAGGFVYKKDSNGKDWIGVAVQGTGASLWYPCKDSQTDEPDLGTTIKVAVPNGLMNVSNGRFMGSEDLSNGYTRWDWEVKNPINNYDITINVGDYVHFGENYKGLDLDYYVLRENETKARIQFEQVKPMMDCFQSKFGAYPFFEDGFKLVETSFLGMENQSAVSYGNKYLSGYAGTDLSQSGVGLLFDYIIIHESAHEWFGNSITSKDIADMWIHEAFGMYAESVFIECNYGFEKALLYVNGNQHNIRYDKPIIGQYGVNYKGTYDMYYKGALMLNTIRSVIDNDEKWYAMLSKFSNTFRHKIIDTKTVVDFFNQESGLTLTPIFDQYLRYIDIPVFEYRIRKKRLEFRWKTDIVNFSMPLDINIKGKKIRLHPTSAWQKWNGKIVKSKEVEIPIDHFFIKVNVL